MPPSPSKPRNSARVAAQLGGHRGEALAALFLRLKLYRILSRRYKTPVGEIDLIARRFGVTVFVEVKARASSAARPRRWRRSIPPASCRAAQYWLARHPAKAETPFRFDVIFLAPWAWPRHVINAFDVLLRQARFRTQRRYHLCRKRFRGTKNVAQSRGPDGPHRFHQSPGRFDLRHDAGGPVARP